MKKNTGFIFENIDSWLKLTGLVAIFSGIFGLGFQKGMLLSMGLGNLSGNYELREIFNSAILGGLHIFNIVYEQIGVGAWDKFWLLAIVGVKVCLVLGFLVALFLNVNPKKIKIGVRKTPLYVKRFLKPSNSSYILYPIIGVLAGLAIALVMILIRYVFLILGTVLLMFLFMGYFTGQSYVATSYADNPCRAPTKEMEKSESIRQCTQLVVNGKKIMGEVLLENLDGYFLKRNDSFVFLKKDGKGCIYSKFLLKKESENQKFGSIDFSKVDIELNDFCGVKEK